MLLSFCDEPIIAFFIGEKEEAGEIHLAPSPDLKFTSAYTLITIFDNTSTKDVSFFRGNRNWLVCISSPTLD